MGLTLLHTLGWYLTSGLEGADREGRATGPPAEVVGQHRIYVFLKTFSYGPRGLFQKETRLLKYHSGLSLVPESMNSCSFNPSLMSPLLLWWDKKGHWETRVSGRAGCQEGQEGRLECASPNWVGVISQLITWGA